MNNNPNLRGAPNNRQIVANKSNDGIERSMSNLSENNLQKLVNQLINENRKKDEVIMKLKTDNLKMQKRIEELEEMVSSLMQLQKTG